MPRPFVFHMTEEEIVSSHAPEPGTGADSDFYDSDGEPSPGWYAEVSQPGCLPDGIFGPHDSAWEAWDQATDDGATVWPEVFPVPCDKRWTTSILVTVEDEDRIPYYIEIDQTTISGLSILHDWGHDFLEGIGFGTWNHSPKAFSLENGTGPFVAESLVRDLAQHGCASGLFMPAVEYARAREILQYADRMDDYFESVGIDHAQVVDAEGTTSLDYLACRVASLLVESIASALDLEADTVRHRKEDRACP